MNDFIIRITYSIATIEELNLDAGFSTSPIEAINMTSPVALNFDNSLEKKFFVKNREENMCLLPFAMPNSYEQYSHATSFE